MIKTITLKRKYRPGEATLGTLLDGKKQICKTLENEWLDNEVNISCIPEGTYKVRRDSTGQFKYWRLFDVPGRSEIEIHNGNKGQHTRGCILFGKYWCFMDDEIAVSSSRLTLDYLLDRKILPDEFNLKITS